MILFFLRHSEAGYNAATDADRELTIEGEESAKQIGIFCRKAGIVFTHALVSPITRAQQTARLVLDQLPPITIESSEHLTPNSDPRNLFDELKHFTDSSVLLLVSHEPFCSNAISQLINGSSQSTIVMKTGTLACVEVHLPVGKGMGKLHWLIPHLVVKKMLAEE